MPWQDEPVLTGGDLGRGASPDSVTNATVVHIVLSLQPGGLERLVCNLVDARATRGFRHVVCCLDEEGALAEDVRRAGHEVVVLRRRKGSDLGLVLRLASFLRRINPGALHTHSLDPMFYGGPAGKLAGVPARVHTQHNTYLFTKYSARDRLKFRLASRFFTRIVSVGAETDRGIAQLGVSPARRAIIRNGIDAARFASARVGEISPPKADTQIGVVARLSREKGVDVLVDAFALLASKHSDCRLTIVGDGPERPALEEQVRVAGLSNRVDFLGFHPRVSTLLPAFDLFVLPSRSEGIPLALLEAMGAGKACVATRVGGVPEVIADGITGVLVPPEDPVALSDAMHRLLIDPESRASLGAAAHTHVMREWSEDAMARQYAALYRTDRSSTAFRRIGKRVLGFLPRRRIAWHGRPDGHLVALTFDDGPDPEYTPRILDTLRSHGIRSTFFLIGERAEREPALVQRIVQEGHELANHSFTHPHFERLSWQQALGEIDQTEKVLSGFLSASSHLWRPPRGKLCRTSILTAWLRRLTLVMWTVDLKDFEAPDPQSIYDRLAARPLRAGDIVLYHGHNPAALEALPRVIAATVDAGLTAVPVSQLLTA